ncbi:DUF4293 domain-containing protein [Psychroflexus planctonicus]|uniref:DUF4293 domain-containing protein n=1 Tax=Psychroflexus planctonicus TaxID=1526575 RepID=A0ABQ1SGB1_9FLAO|nr:DUF4293 domain-containing protein [Psychroflexus planctonicus]GGE31890.1 hypothetical protein GCM10010832_10260 [Psychroflexus planctonicus]
MIQRRQSLYLLVVVILNGLLLTYVPLWKQQDNSWIFASDFVESLIAIIASLVLALISIFLFKKRKLQFVLGRLNILINFFAIGFFVYTALNLPGEMEISEKGIGGLIPLVSIVFLALANKAIKKDEDLVKSVDRFR